MGRTAFPAAPGNDQKTRRGYSGKPPHPLLRIRDAPWEGVPSRGIAGWVSMLRKWGGDSKKLQTQKKAGGITPKGHAFGGGTMAENPGARTPGNLRFVPTGRAWATSPRYRLSIHWFAAPRQTHESFRPLQPIRHLF